MAWGKKKPNWGKKTGFFFRFFSKGPKFFFTIHSFFPPSRRFFQGLFRVCHKKTKQVFKLPLNLSRKKKTNKGLFVKFSKVQIFLFFPPGRAFLKENFFFFGETFLFFFMRPFKKKKKEKGKKKLKNPFKTQKIYWLGGKP